MRSLLLLILIACPGPETGQSVESDTDTDPCQDLALPMVGVPAGTYALGSPAGEVGRAPDELLHEVVLGRGLCLGVTAVTQGQFHAVMGDNPSHYAECGDDCPVDQVSWHRAAVYANQLSRAEDLGACYACTGSGQEVRCEPEGDPYTCEGYRLPTEAEWEVAARGGQGGTVPGGGSLVAGSEEDCTAGLALDDGSLLQERAWYCASAGGRTHPVGALAPGGYGLHDVVGQVWEWCHDGYGPYEESTTNPVGAGERRVNRGGSWSSVPRKLRAAQRDSDLPEAVDRNLGLRIARTTPELALVLLLGLGLWGGCARCASDLEVVDGVCVPLDDSDLDGWTPGEGDCDDADPHLSPSAADLWGDGVDQDCDGVDGHDGDGDGFASAASGGRDCRDGDPDVHPDAADAFGDGFDTNCDGADGVDADGDGWASLASGGADCDDGEAAVFPGADDVAWDGVDQDCDGEDATAWLDVCAGHCHGCAVASDGALDCWGCDEDGQVGDAPTTGTWVHVACGGRHACALDAGGALACWGRDEYGQVGDAPEGAWTAVTVGGGHSCALDVAGLPSCWGRDDHGQSSEAPDRPLERIAAGGVHTCAVDRGGSLSCWGRDAGEGRVEATPAEGVWDDVAAGGRHTCAVDASGVPSCWGDDEAGQSSPPAWRFASVVASDEVSCGVGATGAVACWGSDAAGLVSDAPWGGFLQVAVGDEEACGIARDASLVCW